MDMMKFLKILFLWNPWSDLKKKIPKCSLGDPFENLFVNFDQSRNMALVDGGYLLLYRNEEFLKILPFETDGQISKWTLQVTFWKLLSKIINLVSIPQKKNRLWLSQKFRWAIQGHLGPLVFYIYLIDYIYIYIYMYTKPQNKTGTTVFSIFLQKCCSSYYLDQIFNS